MIYIRKITNGDPIIAFILLLFLFSCSSPTKNLSVAPVSILFQPDDKEILEQIFNQYAVKQGTSIYNLMVDVGRYFMETPYVAHTLETEKEQLVINLREMDCTTFAENCLAISRTLQSGILTFEQFASELQQIRYRNGVIDGYLSRLHYFCDWIFDNQQKEMITDMSRKIAHTPLSKHFNFMSTHPDSYIQLKENAALIDSIEKQEQEITAREIYFIPEARIAEIEDLLWDGDIVGITTGIEGIAISHVGILVRLQGRIHLLHASSKAEKVVISENTLEGYLLESKSATGIMVARPQ